MGLFKNTKTTGKRNGGIVGVVIAVATIIDATRTLKTYMERRKKK